MLYLLESRGIPRGPRGRRSGWAIASAAVHGSVIGAVVIGGASTMPHPERPTPRPERLAYTAPASPRPSALRSEPRPIPVHRPALTLTALPPMPAAPAFAPALDPAVSPSAWPGMPGSPGLPGPDIAPVGGSIPPGDGVYSARAVDRAVIPLAGNPQPDYPALLRGAGVQGMVLVRFIVDSTGRVEPRSIEVVQASHVLFAGAVERWLVRTRYAPAQVGGSPVRQRVEQRVEFALRP